MKKAKKFVTILAIMSILFSLLLSGCGDSSAAPVQPMSEQRFLLDTVVSVTYYRQKDLKAVQGALDLCADYEQVFSRTIEGGELNRLNAAGTLEVSDALLTVLEASLAECRASNGRFDITMGGVSSLYDFTGETDRRPSPAELQAALAHVDYSKIHIDGHTVTLEDPGAVIDLGAAAKGYIADEMKAYLQKHGVKHAIISLGGNVHTLGGRPDGRPFTVGVQEPIPGSEGLVATVTVTEDSVVTSGVYQRCFVADGLLWHHLLDPETGEPIRNGLVSVSILGADSLSCDILATSCFSLGLEAGISRINDLEDYEALFITEDGTQYRTIGFPRE